MSKTLFEALLENYNITKEDYEVLTREYSLENFYGDHRFKNMNEAVNLIKNAMNQNKRMIIYGDYDADGIMGTSILKKGFDYLNYSVDYYIPSRYLDGYGLNLEHAKEYINKYDVVITVDNGISANEPIKLLKDNNIEVLVIDHHTVQLPLPIADQIIHPEVSEFGQTASSGAFCAYMFMTSLLGRSDKYLSTLAAISLISDMMPLRDYNRNLLRTVFSNYKIDEFIPISLLADHQKLDESIIGMKVAPRINAIGRMIEDRSVNKIVEYFTCNDKNIILPYFDYILVTNEERKNISKEVSSNLIKELSDDAIVSLVDIKEGLIGLVANSIMNKLKKPAIVFCDAGNDELKGSCRSIPGFNVVEAFQKLDKYMITSGGHALAGGCSIKKGDYENFKNDFINLINNSNIQPPIENKIELMLNDVNNDSYKLINTFAPFGEEWKKPLFIIHNIKVSSLTYSKTREHIITKIGNNSKLIGFNISEEAIYTYNYIDIIGNLSQSIYMGFVTTEFHIEDYISKN